MKYIFFFFLLPVTCFAQNLQWAAHIPGGAYEFATAIKLDAAGNIYLTGSFEDTTDFDPGPGVYNLISQGMYSDIFVAKYDPSGSLLWAKKMGGSDLDQSNALAVDNSGNVYTAGSFGGTADFNPGAGTYNMTAASDDVFISKLDANGNFVWAVKTGGAGSDIAYGLALDAAGNIYATGNFAATSDFDPGAGVYNLVAPNSNIFTWKLDPAGNLVWAKQQGGDGQVEVGYAIAIDAQDNVYTTGTFSDTADLDPGAGTYILIQQGNVGMVDRYISKLDVNGNFVMAYAVEGMGYSVGHSIAVDASGNIYTTGTFSGSCDFDPGPGNVTLTSTGGFNDIFISKENASGNYVWAKQIGDVSHYDIGSGIALDAFGNVYVTGYFTGTVDFDPGVGTFSLTSINNVEDIYISVLDNNGNFVNALAFYGYATDRGLAITVDNSQNIYTCGAFNATVDFDPGPGTSNLNSIYGFDIYFLKLDNPLKNSVAATLAGETNISLYPNPADGIFTLQCGNDDALCKVEIVNVAGEIIFSSENHTAAMQIDLSGEAAGIYFVRALTENAASVSKLVLR